ncbi:MAG: NnrS family protein, partial [Steroidobacteraceae bacterium]
IAGRVRVSSALTMLAIGVMIAVIAGDLFVPDGTIAGVIAAIAAVVQAVRLAQWQTRKTLRQPIVWVLHLAYVWLPVGFALKALALLGGVAPAAFWLHALTIGTAATMILGVMTRASLGHTGRPLIIDPVITLAYLLLTGAAVVRVFGLSFLPLTYPQVIILAALLWTAAFVLFVSVYAPMLLRPRVDGKPG